MPLLSCIAALVLAPAEVVINPSDDVWVYPHAGDQVEDGYLRVWGAGEYAIGKPSVGSFDFSYSLVRFEVPDTAGKLVSAELVVTQTKDPAYTADEMAKAPLEARVMTDGWREQSWKFDQSTTFIPKAEATEILGIAVRDSVSEGKPVTMKIDLLKGPAKLALGKTLAIALTSKMDPESMGEGRMYKLYSRNSPDEAYRPKLVLKFE